MSSRHNSQRIIGENLSAYVKYHAIVAHSEVDQQQRTDVC